MTLLIKNNKHETLHAQLYQGLTLGKLVILFHGHPGDSSGGTTVLAQKLAQAGISALTFDHRGCGQSEGSFDEITPVTALDDAKAIYSWAIQNHFTDISLLGSSFGGHTALQLALAFPDQFSKILLRAPAPNMSDEREVSSWSSMLAWKINKYYEQVWENDDGTTTSFKIPYQSYLDAQQTILYEPARDIMTPTLILHGDQDDCVPLKQSITLAKNMPNANLIILEGADHRLRIDGDRRQADRISVDWLI